MVMGILNVTPDSFFDGGRFHDVEAAVAFGTQLVEQGAEIIDVGGESTRPGAAPVEEAEELRRVLPVIRELAWRVKVPISIDTRKVEVAKRAIEAGASIVNDVAANREDPEIWGVVAETGAAYVCMHMQGQPETMQRQPHYEDVVREVGDFFSERISRLGHCGIGNERIILDPGIGFGKTPEHNVQLLGGLRSFTRLGCPVLLGVSRKSFMGKLLGAEASQRLPAGLACACLAIEAGVNMVRTHDVDATVQALRMAEAILENRKIDVGTG